jgi:hypothetical protein
MKALSNVVLKVLGILNNRKIAISCMKKSINRFAVKKGMMPMEV